MLELRSVTTAMAAYGADGLLRTDDLDEIKGQLNEEIRETSGAIRELCGAIMYEQKSLMKDNILLEKRISQLKLQHVAVWDAVVEGHKARVEATNDKIKKVLKHFEQIREESKVSKKQMKKEYGKSRGKERYYKLIGASSSVVKKYINSLKTNDLGFNPENYPQSTTKTAPQPVTVIAVIPNMNNVLIMKSVQRDLARYQALEAEIAPLRTTNMSLIHEETKATQEHDQSVIKLKATLKLSEKADWWASLCLKIDTEIKEIEGAHWSSGVRVSFGYTLVKDRLIQNDQIIRQGQLEELKSIRKVFQSILGLQKE